MDSATKNKNDNVVHLFVLFNRIQSVRWFSMDFLCLISQKYILKQNVNEKKIGEKTLCLSYIEIKKLISLVF